MSAPAPHHSRAQRGRLHTIWNFTIHYSPVAPRLQFGVSKNGTVVHRARDLTSACAWALDRTQEFYNRCHDVVHPMVAQAREVLQQHGRI